MSHQKQGNNELHFFYDSKSSIVGFTLNGGAYTYLKNLQGDVIGVVDSNGNQVATYSYDAWGAITYSSGTMADINPIRYKGYYYDSDIGMYYLQSRYYDPALRRFINADDPSLIEDLAKSSVIGSNLFSYCENNGINESDLSGKSSKKNVHMVAVGLQFEATFSIFTFGAEVIFSFDGKVYLFVYSGGSIGTYELNFIKDNLRKPKNLLNIKKQSGISVCIFAVFKYTKGNFSAKSYSGKFQEVYAVTFNVKVFTSWSPTYLVIGAGYASTKFDVGASLTKYYDKTYILKSLMKYVNQLKSTVNKKGRKIKSK